jgi:hypothetical protein
MALNGMHSPSLWWYAGEWDIYGPKGLRESTYTCERPHGDQQLSFDRFFEIGLVMMPCVRIGRMKQDFLGDVTAVVRFGI